LRTSQPSRSLITLITGEVGLGNRTSRRAAASQAHPSEFRLLAPVAYSGSWSCHDFVEMRKCSHWGEKDATCHEQSRPMRRSCAGRLLIFG